MSLCAWFPLIGTLDNQGTDNVSFTTTNASFQSDGKIGQCLKLGYSSNFTIPSLINAKQISIAYWLKVNTATSAQWKDAIHFQATNGSNTYTCRHELYSNCTASGWFSDCGGTKSGMSCTVGQWAHYAVTMDFSTGISKIYMNGVLFGQGDAINTNFHVTGNNFCLGENGLDLSENDVRIYNHILSPKEVEILARGLILHYPMTGGGRGCANLAKGSNTDSTSTNSFGFSEATGGSTRTIEYDGDVPCAKITRNSTAHSSWSYLWYSNWDRAAIKPSTTYTLSFDIIGSGSGSIGFSGFMQGNATNNISASVEAVQNTFNASKWSHLVFKTTTIADFTNKGTSQTIYMGCSYLHNTDVWIMMKNMKLEEGVNDTPWIPHTSDAGYSTMGLNDNTEYDVSGNKYHGTKTNVTYDSDTPRYVTSTKVTTTSGVFSRPAITLDKFTIAFWGKHTASNKMLMGSCPNISTNNTTWYWYGDNSFKYPSGEFYYEHNAGTYTLNTWMHFVVTYDGSNIRVYRNGVAEGSKAASGTMTLDYLSVGRGYGSNYAENGNVSDFRLYATALTATQVAELYNTSASISNNGTLMGYELVEN